MNVLKVDNENHKAVIELSLKEVVKLSNAFIERFNAKKEKTDEEKMLRWQMSHLHSFMSEQGDNTGLIIRIYENIFGKKK